MRRIKNEKRRKKENKRKEGKNEGYRQPIGRYLDEYS